MSSPPAVAVPQDAGTLARLRRAVIGALFALVLLIPKLLRIRGNARSWMAFRIILAFAGAALVILPLSLWNSWLAGIAGLAMFLAAILLPPAKPYAAPDDKARELGALVVVNGGRFQVHDSAPVPVRLFVGLDKIWALDPQLHALLVIPVIGISSVLALRRNRCWLLQVRWPQNAAEFFFDGFFAEHLARVAEATLSGVMRSPLPMLSRSRAAGA